MKFLTSLTAISFAMILTACGGSDPQAGTSFQTAAVMQTVQVAGANAAAPTVQVAGTAAAGAPGGPVSATEPQPDCAPEGCNGLRIIDANAEAYRLDAMQRAEQEANQQG